MARMLIRGIGLTSGWSRGCCLGAVALALAVVIAADWRIGAVFSMSLPYFLVCGLAVLSLGERQGVAVSIAAALATSAFKHHPLGMLLHHAATPTTEWWNVITRMLQFVLVAIMVSGLKRVVALEQWGASHDDLTGALNKSGFRRGFESAMIRMQTRPANMLFVYMDLDGFKGVNDQYGHAAGDLVLGAFARAARSSIRPNDYFARIGGDEFAALLVLSGEIDGGRVAELLHQRLTRILIGTGFDVTCSMGAVAVTYPDSSTVEDLMDRADTLMYEAKRAGKNTLRISRSSTLTKALHSAYQPPVDGDELDDLLRRVDLAERAQSRHLRRVA